MNRRGFLKSAIAGTGIAAIAACSPAAQSGPAPSAGAAAPKVKRGGILKWQNTQTPSIDISVSPQGNTWAMQLIYDRLLGFRGDTFKDTELVPSLAEKWEVSSDGLKVNLTLRKGVTFSNIAPVNGREFTSADVAWNAEYYKKSIVAFNWDSVARVDTPDKYTATLVLKAPAAQFLAQLGQQTNLMYPKEVFETRRSFKDLAIGTGPFELSSWEPNVNIKVKARKDYWQQGEDGKPMPYVDGVESYTITDYAARVAGMRAGQYDEMYPLSGALKPDAEELKKLGLIVTEAPDTFGKGLLMNFTDPLMADVKVRKAISLAMDRKGFIKATLDGAGKVADFLPLPGWGWDDAKVEQRFGTQDIAGAKKLLQEAGKVGSTITIATYRAGPPGQNDKAGQFIGDNLKEAGFNVVQDIVGDFPTYNETKIISGKYQIMPLTIGDGPDPDGFLFRYRSTEPVTSNRMRIKDPKLDAMVNEQRTIVDVAKRKAAIAVILDYLYDNMMTVPMPQVVLYKVRQPWVRMNGAADHLAGFWRPERVWLDK